jgi:steroid 5-alpha reductase family enzyme
MMINWHIYSAGLLSIGLLALAGWLLSLVRNNVTHVDSMWSLFLGMSAYTYTLSFYELDPRTLLILTLVTIWAIRLCIYLTWRNWNPHEDYRYVAIRENNEPYFWVKSIYIVFGLQAVLAWVVSMPLFGAIASKSAINSIDIWGALIVVMGIGWESVADWQLSLFKAKLNNKGKVLNSGLWRYSRHPNYFGECCVWWGFYLISVGAGAWWTIASPLLMTMLLLKVSGVALLEKNIVERRPDYLQYIKNTNAFIPGFAKKKNR